MNTKVTRRDFIKDVAIIGTTAAGLQAGSLSGMAEARSSANQGGIPTKAGDRVFQGGRMALSKPILSESQIQFRIGLARQRTASYPLDSMDFIMMDLERPDHCSRHAHWCTGDLTGRLLEFLSQAEGVDGKSDPRLSQLFKRILRQQRPSGIFGRLADDGDCHSGANKVLFGLVRYYHLTHDSQALEAALKTAKHLISYKENWISDGISNWVTEPLAWLYGITKNQDYLDFCAMINDKCLAPEPAGHAHGLMTTLRGLQTAALVTGDEAWNKKPESHRLKITGRYLEMPDGCVPEVFPSSPANEGCAIADWLMMNLNAGLISGDDSAYEKAERILWNGLAFNQWITGGFGIRGLAPNGYGMGRFEEAWCCCLHNGGMALTEYARHVVTFRDHNIHVNFLVPGTYKLSLPANQVAEVKISTTYPASAEAVIVAKNIPATITMKVRVPSCIKKPELSRTINGDRVKIVLKGQLGHRIETCPKGVMLTYGPLILAPFAAGPCRNAVLQVQDKADSDGFLQLSNKPLPMWSYFEEGPGALCGVDEAAVNVPVKLAANEIKELRFVPLCYYTSNLSLWDTPISFAGVV